VDTAVDLKAGTLVIGDVRDIADQVDCGKVQNQKISQWNHGQVRRYITYKAEAEGITVHLVDEAYTTQTCPNCTHRHKPKGRRYRCPACGFQAHRDVVGQVNILSVFVHGERRSRGHRSRSIVIRTMCGLCVDAGTPARNGRL
jgi:putative transposase